MKYNRLFPSEDVLYSLSTLVLPVGGTVVADTVAVRGLHHNVIVSAADQVTQCAVGARAVAGEGLSIVGGYHSIAHCVFTGGPQHLGSSSTADELAGHVRGSAWLCKGNQIKRQSLPEISVSLT